ncbi:MAG: AAA family ATPase [Phycisphaerae bacterium]|nr:AAA family ATPase [Phycisphaerae bacterium]
MTATLMKSVHALRDNVAGVFLGNRAALDCTIATLLARGHLLIEDVPGVGKTVLASALARSIDCAFARIQLTPDLLPTDILGVSIYRRESETFEFKRGPIFANLVLADEINRATPRAQTALLEAMNEAAVTVDGRTYPLDPPFMLVATQNPHEFEGTYALPENQLDRFLMRIKLGYPSAADEARVLELRPAARPLHELRPVMTGAEMVALQSQTDRVRLDRTLIDYIIALAARTRDHGDLRVGVSPRGALALAQAARATAVLSDRAHVIPEDISACFLVVCAHRVIPNSYSGSSEAAAAEAILTDVLHATPSPT